MKVAMSAAPSSVSNVTPVRASRPRNAASFGAPRRRSPGTLLPGLLGLGKCPLASAEPAPKHYHKVAATPVTPPLRH